MVHLQHRAVGQPVAAAELRDEGLRNDLRLKVAEKCFVDVPLDLLPGQPAARLEAEDIAGLSAGEGLFPDADGGLHADVALPHGKLLLHHQPLRPARHHPFALDLHDVFLPFGGFCIYSSTLLWYYKEAADRVQKPLPLGEVSPKVTERASRLWQSLRTAISSSFVKAMLSQRPCVSFSILALSGASRQLSQRESFKKHQGAII